MAVNVGPSTAATVFRMDYDAYVQMLEDVDLGRLGKGAFGQVFRLKRTALEKYVAGDLGHIQDEFVALKVFNELDASLSPEEREKITLEFERELAISLRVSNDCRARGLVCIYGHVIVEKKNSEVARQIIIMEYVGKFNLKTTLSRLWFHNPVPPAFEIMRRLLSMIDVVARSISYLHKMGVIHNDIKPENILMRDSGEPVLADFGLGCLWEDCKKDKGQVGTKKYFSYKKYTTKTADMSKDDFTRADVWAFAVCMEMMLSKAESSRIANIKEKDLINMVVKGYSQVFTFKYIPLDDQKQARAYKQFVDNYVLSILDNPWKPAKWPTLLQIIVAAGNTATTYFSPTIARVGFRNSDATFAVRREGEGVRIWNRVSGAPNCECRFESMSALDELLQSAAPARKNVCPDCSLK